MEEENASIVKNGAWDMVPMLQFNSSTSLLKNSPPHSSTVKEFKFSYLAIHCSLFTILSSHLADPSSIFYPFFPSSGACEVAAKLQSLPLFFPPPCHTKNRVSFTNTHTTKKLSHPL